MAKVADKYFVVDEWKVIEDGFNPDYGKVSESIFSIANEYMGVRGYFEEGYSGEKLIGSYFNGIYEQTEPDYGHYKGIADFTEYMVNAVDWLYTRISLEGEVLDLALSNISNFRRELDFRTGRLSRSFVWTTKSGKKLKVSFERFVSMNQVDTAAQRIQFKALNFEGEIDVTSGLDLSVPHMTQNMNMWNCVDKSANVKDSLTISLEGQTINTCKKVFTTARIDADCQSVTPIETEKTISLNLILHLNENEEKTITKYIKNVTFRDHMTESEYETNKKNAVLDGLDYEEMCKKEEAWWADVWEKSDIIIDGDVENQQGIRFCIFQLFQTYHGAVWGSNIGAKGLTGEAYNGNAFWDTETYCLPFFLFNNKEAARNLLFFRYATLNDARDRAKVLDCEGAFYPIATISGKECCNLWQHASLQLQASTAVAYGIWFYEKMFNDKDFMKDYGIEMLIEISRMLATRGDYSAEGKYGYYCVMGPDEFQMMVHNNCYTNYMGRFTFEYTIEKLAQMKSEDKDAYDAIAGKLSLKDSEIEKWTDMAEKMFIPYDEKSMIFEQHEGFFKLPHVDVDAIPITDFPLYNNWTYDRIYRNDMIKQPDVLMFMLMFNSKFSPQQLRANYEYYEPRCIHESSLSPSVHSILATQLHKDDEAYDFFGFATRMDLDNYNRNTGDGIHTTSIAAAWMNIVYGFGGLRTDGEEISISPSIPKDWNRYIFKISYADDVLEVNVSKDKLEMKTLHGNEVEINVYGNKVAIGGDGYSCRIG
ncbi:MAG: family 65 glycosyl hydrolase [Lachnospiraceae bacterium]|nr:family 65 glycosyl hydrolase [Lachnospiraceae bacterium]